MTTLRIDFCDFWDGFRKEDNFFANLLRRRYEVEIDARPDFLFFADNGCLHRRYRCPRIFFSGEAREPDWRVCDWGFTYSYMDDPRHLRLPLYVWYAEPEQLCRPPGEAERILSRKSKFCAFVVGNTGPRKRIKFFQQLSRYKRVDSGGRGLNNIGRAIGPLPSDKTAFLEPYKFNLCFENQSLPGYVTEKLPEALRAGCVPVYWGSQRVQEEFNPKSFLNLLDFPDENALVERIKEIDRDDDLLLEYLRQPCFADNRPNQYFDPERLLDQFERIFSARITPVGRRRRWFQIGGWFQPGGQEPRPADPPA